MRIEIGVLGNPIYLGSDDFDGYEVEEYVTLEIPFELLKDSICDYFGLKKNQDVYDTLDAMQEYYLNELEDDNDFIDELTQKWQDLYNEDMDKWEELCI